MWFDSWADILRVLIIGSVLYAALVVVLRVSGKRTLGQLNAFDFIVTVALGSTLARILLSSDVAFLRGDGVGAARGPAVRRRVGVLACARGQICSDVQARGTRFFGELQHAQLRRNRLSESEVLQAVRGTGSGDLADTTAVVLEISVIPKSKLGDGSALYGVHHAPWSGHS
ncbi:MULTISPECIES: DUF421 domain-containing protein [unclassified Arthrobacter]|uniref:DUF421 domain-containing protein n=1 Tax=unclassified Arthrobacter TaxID=235627 RepID=UPI003396000C